MGVSVTSLITIKAYIGDKIYKNVILDYLEFTYYFNIVLLTIATSYYLRQPNYQRAAASISVSLALVMFLCTLFYHIAYVLQNTKCMKTLRILMTSRIRHFNVDKDQYHSNFSFAQETEMKSVEVTTPTSSVVSLSPQHKTQDEDSKHLCNINNSVQIQSHFIATDKNSESASWKPSNRTSYAPHKGNKSNTLHEPLLQTPLM